jgi:hypothetical protein
MGRALSATNELVGTLVLCRPLNVQVCLSYNTVTIMGYHPLFSTLAAIVYEQSPHLQYPLYLVLSVASMPSSNSLSMKYCRIARRNSFMLGYKLSGFIIGLFLSNINLSPGRCWNIGMATEPSSHPLRPVKNQHHIFFLPSLVPQFRLISSIPKLNTSAPPLEVLLHHPIYPQFEVCPNQWLHFQIPTKKI